MNTIDQNFLAFQKLLPTILEDHRGQHALLYSGKIKGYFPTSLDAIKAGIQSFGEGRFSVQQVDDKIEDLGFYSHVDSALQA
ncbi:MAG: hypothetical protein COA41_01335 [Sphingopyxis sp.]|nr:MAG: hypothetical protein COA41_01335 [Sphingopyxis sp.]